MAPLLLALLAGGGAWSQLVINEVCSKNNGILQDEHGRTPDWIELYNAGSEPVQLGTHFLSDRLDAPGLWRLPEGELLPGDFVIFFSAHEQSGQDHFSFGIAQSGEGVFLSGMDLQLLHGVEVPALQPDHSYGNWNSSSEQRIFPEPTPGMPNATMGYTAYTATPTTLPTAGWIPSNTVLHVHSEPEAVVHITVDGSEPNTIGAAFNGYMSLTNTVVIKAVARAPGKLPSEVMTATFFVDESKGLPAVSLSVHPDSLFHEEFGLYMLGPNADTAHPYLGANYWSDRQIPVHFEFFDEEGHLGLVQQVDLKMHGGSQARTRPQRSMRLTARGRYGSDVMEYPFFPERGRLERYKHLVLRNSGGDFCLAHFRDGLWHRMAMEGGLDIDALGFRPVKVFINGSFWGIMNLRERTTKHHVANLYDLDPEKVLMMENENLPREGDTIHFAQLRDHILNNDMNDVAHFSQVSDQLDMASFKDYFALELFAGNADWPANNVRYWKPSPEEGKWRYLLQDLDATMNVFGWVPLDFDAFWWTLVHREGWTHSEIFRSLLANDEFRRTFINRMADMMNTVLSQPRFQGEVDRIRGGIESEIGRHFQRWSLPVEDFHWHAGELIPEFGRKRAGHVRQQMVQTFGLSHTVDLGFAAFPPGAGRIELNTIDPDLPFRGTYFHGNAIDLRAVAADGFEFDHWEWKGNSEATWPDAVERRDILSHGAITAVFRRKGTPIHVFPNPFQEQLSVSLEVVTPGPALLSLWDAQGREVMRQALDLRAGLERIDLALGSLTPGLYLLSVQGEGLNQRLRIARKP